MSEKKIGDALGFDFIIQCPYCKKKYKILGKAQIGISYLVGCKRRMMVFITEEEQSALPSEGIEII